MNRKFAGLLTILVLIAILVLSYGRVFAQTESTESPTPTQEVDTLVTETVEVPEMTATFTPTLTATVAEIPTEKSCKTKFVQNFDHAGRKTVTVKNEGDCEGTFQYVYACRPDLGGFSCPEGYGVWKSVTLKPGESQSFDISEQCWAYQLDFRGVSNGTGWVVYPLPKHKCVTPTVPPTDPTATPTATLTPTFTATPTNTATITSTPTEGPSPTPTNTATITSTPTEGPSPTPTKTLRPPKDDPKPTPSSTFVAVSNLVARSAITGDDPLEVMKNFLFGVLAILGCIAIWWIVRFARSK